MALSNHFAQGGAYPVGGAASYVAKAVATVEAFGGRAFVRAPVSSIILDASGRVSGVQVKGVTVSCDTVVSSVGVHTTLQRLLPCPAPPSLPALGALQARLAASGLEHTNGHVSLFVTLEGTAEELQLPRHNCW